MGGPIILLPSRPLAYNMGMVRVLVEMHRYLILLHPVIMLPLIAFLQDAWDGDVPWFYHVITVCSASRFA
jgi:hypothetical protein